MLICYTLPSPKGNHGPATDIPYIICLSLRKIYTWWSPKSSYSGFHVKSTWKPYKSNNSRKTLQFHGVQWEGYVSWFHMKFATKDQQLPGMITPMFYYFASVFFFFHCFFLLYVYCALLYLSFLSSLSLYFFIFTFLCTFSFFLFFPPLSNSSALILRRLLSDLSDLAILY